MTDPVLALVPRKYLYWKAVNPHELHPTSILDVYKVFQHLEMLWMGIWVHPYAVIHAQVGVNFRKTGVWPSLYDVVVSWLRLLCYRTRMWISNKSSSVKDIKEVLSIENENYECLG